MFSLQGQTFDRDYNDDDDDDNDHDNDDDGAYYDDNDYSNVKDCEDGQCNIYFQILPQCLLPKQKNGAKWHKQSCGAVKNERDEKFQRGEDNGWEERENSMNPNGFQSDKGWTGKQAKWISTCQTFSRNSQWS